MRENTTRHYETSRRNTELLMSGALKAAMAEKPLAKITVREITERCGLNRKTFYYHFEDIYDLLRWTMEHDVLAEFRDVEQCCDAEELLEFFIQYADRNRKLLRAVVDAMNGAVLKRELYNGFHRVVRLCIEQVEQEQRLAATEDYREFVLDFYADALSSCLLRYVQQRQPSTQQAMIVYTRRVLRQAIPALLRSEETKKVIP